jgi:Tol biopolymer transport system component
VLAPSRVTSDGNGKPERLFPESVRGVALSWTKDRQTVLVRREAAQTGPDLLAISLDGKQVPVAESTYAETEGQFSPDGKWIAYVSNENGRPEVYLQSFPRTGGHTQVSIDGGTQVRWAAGGNEIFYIAPDGAMTAAAVTFTNGTAEIARPVTLFPTHLASGTNVIGNKPQYAISRDGRFLLNSIVESASLPIVVSLNRLR